MGVLKVTCEFSTAWGWHSISVLFQGKLYTIMVDLSIIITLDTVKDHLNSVALEFEIIAQIEAVYFPPFENQVKTLV